MYGIKDRDQLLTYVDGVFMPVARPANASDVIVNVASFGTNDWEGDGGVCEGLKQVIMGPQCINTAGNGFICSACGFDLAQDACERVGSIIYCPHCGSKVVDSVNVANKVCGDLAND